MELTFLGTAAAEQYPGIWCTCDYCTRARQLGGKNIRKTSSIHFAENCLIDFPPEVFSQADRFGVDLMASRLLLVTHSHEDHFYPQLLTWRYRPKDAPSLSLDEIHRQGYARQQELPMLHIFGNQCTLDMLEASLEGRPMEDFAMDFTVVEPYREYQCENVTFIPLVASHVDRGDQKGLIYVVSTQGKTFLYATDSGTYNEETRRWIARFRYDAIIMEETRGYALETSGNHMYWEAAMDERKFFETAGVWKKEPRIYWTHMSPHRTPPQTDLEEILKDTPITPAYDGMKIEL